MEECKGIFLDACRDPSEIRALFYFWLLFGFLALRLFVIILTLPFAFSWSVFCFLLFEVLCILYSSDVCFLIKKASNDLCEMLEFVSMLLY